MSGSVSALVVLASTSAGVVTTLLVCGVTNILESAEVSSLLSFSLAQGGNNTVMDQVQTVYQCCGVRGAEGYDQWRDYLEDLYPDSCCTLKYPGCGHQAMATLSSDFANTFPDMLFTEGCLTVLRWKSS